MTAAGYHIIRGRPVNILQPGQDPRVKYRHIAMKIDYK